MKINSNTIYLTKESLGYEELEDAIKKIASENNIDNVDSIQISLSPEKGIINFKSAQEVPIENQTEEQKIDWNKQMAQYQKDPELIEKPQEETISSV